MCSKPHQEDFPEVLKKLHQAPCYPGAAIGGVAAASYSTPETAALAMAAALGGIAGPEAYVLGMADERISPDFNLVVSGAEYPAWQKLQRLVIAPVEIMQRRLRELSHSLRPERLGAFETDYRTQPDLTKTIFESSPDLIRETTRDYDPGRYRKSEVLRLPSVMLSAPTPEIFRKGVEEVLDRRAWVIYPEGQLFHELTRFVPGRHWQELLVRLVEGLEGHDSSFKPTHANEGYGRLAAFKASLLLTCRKDHAATIVGSGNPHLQRLLSQCLVVPPKLGEHKAESDPGWMRAGYTVYSNVVTKVLSARRRGDGLQFQISQPDRQLLFEYSAYLVEILPQVNGDIPPANWVLELPWKLAWAMMALKDQRENGEWCIPYAIHVAHTALLAYANFIREERRRVEIEAQNQMRAMLLERLGRMGPCGFRELVRTFRIQRKALYEPTLDALIIEGLVVREDNRYLLASPVVQESL